MSAKLAQQQLPYMNVNTEANMAVPWMLRGVEVPSVFSVCLGTLISAALRDGHRRGAHLKSAALSLSPPLDRSHPPQQHLTRCPAPPSPASACHSSPKYPPLAPFPLSHLHARGRCPLCHLGWLSCCHLRAPAPLLPWWKHGAPAGARRCRQGAQRKSLGTIAAMPDVKRHVQLAMQASSGLCGRGAGAMCVGLKA
jgi:hypothetical protein